MVRYSPTPTFVGVGSAGKVSSLAVPDGFAGYPIVKIDGEQLQGEATHATLELSTDSAFADQGQRIATFEGLNKTSPVGHTNNGAYYPWDGVVSGGVIHFRIIAETGVDNEYSVSVHFDEEVTP